MKLAGTRILQAKDSQEYDKLSAILVNQGYEPVGPAQPMNIRTGTEAERQDQFFFWQEWHKPLEPPKLSQVQVMPKAPVLVK